MHIPLTLFAVAWFFVSFFCDKAPKRLCYTLAEDNYVVVSERLQSYSSVQPLHGDQKLVIQPVTRYQLGCCFPRETS